MFDYVVVDTPAQFSEHVLTAMDASAHHVLLTTPDVPALKNLRVTLDMLDLLSYPRQIRSIVLNRSDSKVGLSLDDVERVLRCPIAAHIPSSRAVPISINKGTPITLASPDHPVSQAIARFAQQRLLARGGAGRAAAGRAQARQADRVSLSDRLAQRLAPAAVQPEQPGPDATAPATSTRSPRSSAACTRRCWRHSARGCTTRTSTSASWSSGSRRRCRPCCSAKRPR